MNKHHSLNAVKRGVALDRSQAIQLLEIENSSNDYYRLLSVANELTRTEFENSGLVFAQIGLNSEPCSVDCRFCSMGESHFSMDEVWKKSEQEIIDEVEVLVAEGIDDLFLMTTADYPQAEFLHVLERVRKVLPDSMRLVANIGDFDLEMATALKKAGATGAYHIHRLREGEDTKASPTQRIATLDAIRDAGLELYYCVEPIGPEHTYQEIAEEMIRARDYNVGVMAVMRRIPVRGTPLFGSGQISAVELSKIAAVARLVSRPHRAMNAHEPVQMSLIGGVNQLYAEVGANPRDDVSKTEQNRGLTVAGVRRLLEDAEYRIQVED